MKKYFLIVLIFLSVSLIADDFKDYKSLEQHKFQGNKIFNEMVRSLGNINNIENIKTKGQNLQTINAGDIWYEVKVISIFPDKFKINFQGKEFIVDGDEGWLKYPQGYFENLPEDFIEILKGNLKRNLINIAKQQEKFEILHLGDKELDGEYYDIISLISKDLKLNLVIDKRTNLPRQMIYEGDSKQPVTIYRTFKAYSNIDGIYYPVHTVSEDETGNKISEVKIQEVKFNVDMKRDEF